MSSKKRWSSLHYKCSFYVPPKISSACSNLWDVLFWEEISDHFQGDCFFEGEKLAQRCRKKTGMIGWVSEGRWQGQSPPGLETEAFAAVSMALGTWGSRCLWAPLNNNILVTHQSDCWTKLPRGLQHGIGKEACRENTRLRGSEWVRGARKKKKKPKPKNKNHNSSKNDLCSELSEPTNASGRMFVHPHIHTHLTHTHTHTPMHI